MLVLSPPPSSPCGMCPRTHWDRNPGQVQSMKGHSSGLSQPQFQPYYKLRSEFLRFRKLTCYLKHPGCDVKLIYALPPFCWMLANSADPNQTPHNQGGVGSGSPLLFARNLNKKEKHQKQDPNSGYELVQKIKMGNSLRHVRVNIKCENE